MTKSQPATKRRVRRKSTCVHGLDLDINCPHCLQDFHEMMTFPMERGPYGKPRRA